MAVAHLIRYVLRRLGLAVAFLLVTSFGVFALLHLAPGDPVRALLGTRPSDPETLRALRAQYHLDEPLLVQYGRWLSQVLHVDLGRSIGGMRSVATMIGERAGVTCALVLISTVVVLGAGVLLGSAAAYRRGTRLDRVAVLVSVVGVASPAYVTSLLLLYVFGVVLGWFPTFGPGDGLADRMWHLVLPSAALVISMTAIIVKITRAAVVEELDKDYVAFARSRGLGPTRIALAYVVRNALIPVITAAGVVVIGLLTNALYVEVTFALPGIGSLMVDAVQKRDLPVVQGAALAFTGVVVVVNLVVDVAYALVDPRIRFTRVAA
jgi:peptide/nickel transport system permease protein